MQKYVVELTFEQMNLLLSHGINNMRDRNNQNEKKMLEEPDFTKEDAEDYFGPTRREIENLNISLRAQAYNQGCRIFGRKN